MSYGFSEKVYKEKWDGHYAEFKGYGMSDDEAYVLACLCLDPRSRIMCAEHLKITRDRTDTLYKSAAKIANMHGYGFNTN